MNGKQKFFLLLALFQFILLFTVFFSINGIVTFVEAQTQEASSYDYYNTFAAGMLAIAASIALGLPVLGAGIALRTVGTAAISALSEREENFFKAFLVVALCEALAIYGLIIAVLLWTKIPAPPTV